MGILLSRFRKKDSALEVLEKLETKIKKIEESKSYAQTRQRKIAKLLYLYSFGMCLVCGIVMYFVYSSKFNEKLIYLMPLALSPLVLLLASKIMTWYYVKLINKSQSHLVEMKKEKKRILDEVMEKETYKVAKEILEKYSTEVPKPNPELRQRHVISPNGSPKQMNQGQMPMSKLQSLQSQQLNATQRRSPMLNKPPGVQRSPGPMMRLPAPILPLERSYLDRMVEYLIGDGPNNRFALICSRCHSHNGMALKEEFEYISFKCCYCFFCNPARKIRPEAPKLEESFQNGNSNTDSDSDENSEKTKADVGSDEKTVNGENGKSEIVEPGEKNQEENEKKSDTPEPEESDVKSVNKEEPSQSNSNSSNFN